MGPPFTPTGRHLYLPLSQGGIGQADQTACECVEVQSLNLPSLQNFAEEVGVAHFMRYVIHWVAYSYLCLSFKIEKDRLCWRCVCDYVLFPSGILKN